MRDIHNYLDDENDSSLGRLEMYGARSQVYRHRSEKGSVRDVHIHNNFGGDNVASCEAQSYVHRQQ